MMSTTTRKSGGGRKISLAYDEEVVDDPQRTTTDAVLPEAGDNCAIARVALAAGRAVRVARRSITLRSRCPEGWRFAVRRVPAGAPLTSWSLPFGDAVRDVAAGDVLSNGARASAAGRGMDLPRTSRTGSTRTPAAAAPRRRRRSGAAARGDDARLLRTLAGFASHPNVFGVVVLGTPLSSPFSAAAVLAAAPRPAPRALAYAVDGDAERAVADVAAALRSWLPAAQACARTVQPAATLAVALQCGGSDAFSGVSGNPCVGDAAWRVVERGGRCLLAETDELMGAEAYVLARVRDGAVRDAFLALVDRYRRYLAAHGQTAEANPSGGNKQRGLYNIALKSLGAAKKKHASLRLEGCVEYGAPLPAPRGYYFMDSPGNDLESVAGQVAAGCTVIHFVTGNGSVTNFPFAPTVKIVTTSARYALLAGDMDFDAGRYQAGAPMAALGRELFELTLRVASGERTRGEAAGHSQLSIWRAPSQLAFDATTLTALADRHGGPAFTAAAAAARRRRRARPRGASRSSTAATRAPRPGSARSSPRAPGAARGRRWAATVACGRARRRRRRRPSPRAARRPRLSSSPPRPARPRPRSPRRSRAPRAPRRRPAPLARAPPAPSLAFGQRPARAAAGVYVMDSPTSSLAEMTAALVAAHADVVVCVAATPDGMLAAHGHAFVPVVRAAAAGGPAAAHADVVCDDPGAVARGATGVSA
ncbi:D-galactarate dehydratase / altronate hydrolase [Aureococcus anophagefferens]|nr:D-galactarate dehydratase / altronate hydrolase [Aureococcus anophagefferens]